MKGILHPIGADGGTAEGNQVGPHSEPLTDIMGECPNVGTFRTYGPESNIVPFFAQKREFVNRDDATWAIDLGVPASRQ